MSNQDSAFLPAWQPAAGVPHDYPLQVRDHGLTTAFGLLMQSLPYALARFGILLGASVACMVWLVVTLAGTAWLGTHVASAFGWVWFIGCVLGAGFVWGTVLRYSLHLIACGHVAVLTDLITRGIVGDGKESQFAYGQRIVTARFGQVNALFAMNALIRGVLQAFHSTLDWLVELLPIPGLDAVDRLLTMILRAATRYMDKVMLSYNLATGSEDVWRGSREGIVYYCQNAKPILKTSVWIVIQERLLTLVLWLALLAPAAGLTLMLPSSARETGGLMTVVIAVLLAGTLRAAFIKPLFLIVLMVRFHALIEQQPINAEWLTYLDGVSEKFRTMGPTL